MNINEKLFGATKKVPATGGHKANKIVFQDDFESPDSVMFLFCSACGNHFELNKEIAIKFILSLDESQQMADRDYFIEASSCELCSDENKPKKVCKI